MKLYTDGSVIVKNPSKYGGTFAYVIAGDHLIEYEGSGVHIPGDLGTETVTNNQMELAAVLYGLRAAKVEGYKIDTIVSDSKVTLGRLFQGWKLNNIPAWMVRMLEETSLRGIRGVFVKGHSGNEFNERADRLAHDKAVQFLKDNGLSHLIYAYENPWWNSRRWKNSTVKS